MARTVSCRSLHSNLWCVDLYPLCCLITINVSIIHILIQNRGGKGERSAFIKIIKAFPEPLPQHTSTQGLAGQTWVLCPARETANLKGWVLGGRGLRSAHHPILYNPQTENEFYIFKGLGQGGGGGEEVKRICHEGKNYTEVSSWLTKPKFYYLALYRKICQPLL